MLLHDDWWNHAREATSSLWLTSSVASTRLTNVEAGKARLPPTDVCVYGEVFQCNGDIKVLQQR